jgi:flagellar motor component MotA
MNIDNIIGVVLFITVVTVGTMVMNKIRDKWGHLVAIWANRILLAAVMVASVYTESTIAFWISGIGLAFNLLVYNPWSMPAILEKIEELEKERKENKES